MSDRRTAPGQRRAREFEAFVTGAAGRLLHTATLLTAEIPGDSPRARRLLLAALAHTCAHWDRLRDEDPYDHARHELVGRFARGAWRGGRTGGGVLGRIAPKDRLVVVLTLYEGVPEEQTAALLGLPVERVGAVRRRAVAELCEPPEPVLRPARAGGPGGSGRTP
ncbi:RNA polymerase subunit sigma-70 [Streptomyces sp. NPDC020141]|uniref:RNA polymerase subunit sigma-70 n=1 Tax=Streptomyces sp. NPDC020141 TaxID=3365065 RepID=UPI0037987B9F